MVFTWRNYAVNDNCSPCRRKYSAVLKKETHFSASVEKVQRKQHGQTVEEGFDSNSQEACALIFP